MSKCSDECTFDIYSFINRRSKGESTARYKQISLKCKLCTKFVNLDFISLFEILHFQNA